MSEEMPSIQIQSSEPVFVEISESSSLDQLYPSEASKHSGDQENVFNGYEITRTPTEVEESLPSFEPSYSFGDDYGRKGSYFKDRTRKIDFILVYEEESLKPARQEKVKKWRSKFISNLALVGLQMEEEVVTSQGKTIHYIKLNAPWHVLCAYAELLSVRAPIEVHPNPMKNWSEELMAMLHIPNILALDVPNKPIGYYTCPFKEAIMDRYLGIEDREEFFTSVQRSSIVYEILQNAVFGRRDRSEIGIGRLIEENVFDAAFPLHDGPYQMPKECVPPEKLNRRQILYEYWARWGRWYKYQPLNHIREYFGEKIAIYFAWLGFYTTWLLPASVVGIFVFLYGLFTVWNDVPTNEICQSGDSYVMCPLCNEKEVGCDYWHLSDTCLFAKIGYLFDQPASVFYSVFISFWAVTFLKYWKRQCADLAHHWDCMGFEEEVELPRPEFTARAERFSRNAITGAMEPTFPKRIRYTRMMAGAGVLLIMVTIVLIFVFAVIIYRLLVTIPLFQHKAFRGVAKLIASLSAAMLNLLFIMLIGRVYERIAARLTDWEMHRTQTEYENHFTFKVFVFQFVNFYSSIFYVAFFKGRFVGHPGHYTRLFGAKGETCGNIGCFLELALQLAVIMIGKQIINNAREIIIPKVKTRWHQRRTGIAKYVIENQPTRWSEDYLMIDNEGLFEEYLEMVLQFGFITIFVVAFPLAPLFALLNNWMEIRLDAQKFICETRRSVSQRAENIGVWFKILQALAHIAVISNAFLIAFTSQYLPRILYSYTHDQKLHGFTNFTLAWAPNGTMPKPCRYLDFRDENGEFTLFYWKLLFVRLAFVIVFEYFVFGVCRLIDFIVPDIPASLEVKIKRNMYLAKQALNVTEALVQARHVEDEREEE